jgi:hypothetical protein
MTDPKDMQYSNHFNTGSDRRSSCCSYCCNDSSSSDPLIVNEFESQALATTPPLENLFLKNEEYQPFSCIYLLNLFLAPDITQYLAETSISDDVYSLPVHLQKLICEARMEVLVSKQKNHPTNNNNAVKRLEKVREYIKSVAHNEAAATIATLSELIRDEDEMSIILE